MSFELVDVYENETNDALISEMLSLPMLIRQTSATQLLRGSLSDWFGLPAVIKDARPRASLLQGTISGRLGIPELARPDQD